MIILDTLRETHKIAQLPPIQTGTRYGQLLGGHVRPSGQFRHHPQKFPSYLGPVTKTWRATDSQKTPIWSKALPHCHCTKNWKWSMCKCHCFARLPLLHLLPTDTWPQFLLRYDRSLGGTVKQTPIHPILVVTTWISRIYQLFSMCYTFIEVKIKFSESECLLHYFLISSFVHSTKETKKEIEERKRKKGKERKLWEKVSNMSTISYIISRYMLSGAGVASPSQVCAPAMLILLSRRTVS